ncbi:hypothetical protein [Arthrobacter sp. SLBN-112]|uniref:hypothetical protein n=1 Tax=Arthrobacter sp. SLBN-112 TaxID=2768452 RepID=UPI0027B4778A|nr:hypothetical protein [Arthrobacter sp. SLBN-112]MDQ0801374.1 pyrroline-5-carboxylate reductase [Arthrobacter sp. SLBN-112]
MLSPLVRIDAGREAMREADEEIADVERSITEGLGADGPAHLRALLDRLSESAARVGAPRHTATTPTASSVPTGSAAASTLRRAWPPPRYAQAV